MKNIFCCCCPFIGSDGSSKLIDQPIGPKEGNVQGFSHFSSSLETDDDDFKSVDEFDDSQGSELIDEKSIELLKELRSLRKGCAVEKLGLKGAKMVDLWVPITCDRLSWGNSREKRHQRNDLMFDGISRISKGKSMNTLVIESKKSYIEFKFSTTEECVFWKKALESKPNEKPSILVLMYPAHHPDVIDLREGAFFLRKSKGKETTRFFFITDDLKRLQWSLGPLYRGQKARGTLYLKDITSIDINDNQGRKFTLSLCRERGKEVVLETEVHEIFEQWQFILPLLVKRATKKKNNL